MNILFITPEYPHPNAGNSGGIGTSIKNLAASLLHSGHNVYVLLYGANKDLVINDNGVEIHCVENIKVKGFSWWLSRKKVEKYTNDYLIPLMKLDIVEVADWTGFSAFLKLNAPVIMRLHGSDTYFCKLEGRKQKYKNFFFEKKAYTQVDKIIAVSDFVGRMSNRFLGIHRCYEVIHNGVSLETFMNVGITQAKDGLVLYFGTLIRKKGCLDIPFIFNALNQMNPDAHLELVGRDSADIKTGSLSTWTLMENAFSDSVKRRVNYVGPVPYSEIVERIASASVCIFPSYAEACPLSWLEAMAMGKAIVASNIGWANEIIEDGVEGYLVDPSDHKEYAYRINLLLNDIDLREKLGINARMKVENYLSSKIVADKSVECYQKLILERAK